MISFDDDSIHVVVVEGNIAAGKSTFIERVGAALRRRGVTALCVPEPVDAWRSVGTECVDILDAAYQAPRENAFPFQVTALTTHAQALRRALDEARQLSDGNGPIIVLVERWPCSYRHVFVRYAQEHDFFTKEHSAVYELLYDELRSVGVEPSLVLLLDARTDLCARRRQQRGRACESGVDAAYLDRLNDLYGELFAAPHDHFAPTTRIKRVDVARDLVGLVEYDAVASRWAAGVLALLALDKKTHA